MIRYRTERIQQFLDLRDYLTSKKDLLNFQGIEKAAQIPDRYIYKFINHYLNGMPVDIQLRLEKCLTDNFGYQRPVRFKQKPLTLSERILKTSMQIAPNIDIDIVGNDDTHIYEITVKDKKAAARLKYAWTNAGIQSSYRKFSAEDGFTVRLNLNE